MSRAIGFEYDQAGRVIQETLPDGRQIGMNYDNNSNVTTITPPGKPAHNFDYTPVDLTKDYIPPFIGITNASTSYSYDLDRRPTEVIEPAESTLMPLSNNTENTSMTYDGSLLTGATWSGIINGSVGFTYNNDFRVSSETLSSGNTIKLTWDNDGLLTGAGSLVINRDSGNGLVTGSTLGNLTDKWTYNGFGEPVSYSALYGNALLLSEQYTRDNLGRITQKTETLGGVTSIYSYGYDLAGRLTDVYMNGAQISHYDYDSNGNRADYIASGAVINGTYDAQDRILTYGQYSYTQTDNGELATKTGPGGTTKYGYDNFGNLQSVLLPDGTQIDYVIDGQNRRVGKRVNGVLVQGFLYESQLRPVAELDGNGNIVSQFVYGTKVNVPDYMIKNGSTYRIITDHLGSPRLVIDVATGQIAQQMTYDEFGNVVYDSNPGFQPFGFAGGLYDKDTGLVRFGARDYDAYAGRWTAKDPIGFESGNPNLYSYTLDDPINLTDILGLEPGGGPNASIGPPSKSNPLLPSGQSNSTVTGCHMPSPPPMPTFNVPKWEWWRWVLGRTVWDLMPGNPPFMPYPQGYGNEGPVSNDNTFPKIRVSPGPMNINGT
jgi:RHS repeat-associated protein